MIIVSCKGNTFIVNNFLVNNKLIYCRDNDYIKSIEYIDNEFEEVLIKETYYDAFFFFNLKRQYHNPIGPAVEAIDIDISECDSFDEYSPNEYWINGSLFSKEKFEEIMKNDYNRL